MNKHFMLIFGLFVLLAGAFILYLGIRDSQSCTYETVGTVVDIHREETVESHNRISYSYFPVVTYTYEGREITSQCSYGGTNDYEIGQQLTILVNPDEPDYYVIKGDNTIIIGAIVSAVGLAVVVFDIIKKTKEKQPKTNCTPEDFKLS